MESAQQILSTSKRLLDGVVDLVGGDAGAVFLRDPDTGQIEFVVTSGPAPKNVYEVPVPPGRGIVGRVISTGVREYIEDAQQDPDFFSDIDEISGLQTRSVLCAPLRLAEVTPLARTSSGEIVGAVEILSQEPKAFGPEALELVAYSADAISIVFGAFQLVDDYQRVIDYAPLAVIGVDRLGRVSTFNREAENLLGYRRSEVIGDQVSPLYAPPDNAKSVQSELDAHQYISNYETFAQPSGEGNPIPVIFDAMNIYDSQGRPTGSYGFIKDLREMRMVDKFAVALSEVQHEETLFQKATELLVRYLDAEICILSLYDDPSGRIKGVAQTGSDSQILSAEDFPVGRGSSGQVFEAGEGCGWNDGQPIPGFGRVELPRKERVTFATHSRFSEFRHVLCVPLIAHGESVGVVKLINCVKNNELLDRGFGPFHLQQLNGLARQLMIRREAIRYETQLRTLSMTGVGSLQLLERKGVLEYITSTVIGQFAYKACLVRMLTGEDLIIEAQSGGLKRSYIGNRRYRLPLNELSREIISRGYYDIYDARRQHSLPILGRREQIRSMMIVPIVNVKGETVGTLEIGTGRNHRFRKDEFEMASIFASQISGLLAVNELLDTSRRIISLKPLQAALQAIVDGIYSSMGFDAVTLFPYDQGSTSFKKAIVKGVIHATDAKGQVRDDAILWEILRKGESAYYTNDAPNDPLMKRKMRRGAQVDPFVVRESIKSSGYQFLQSGDEILGILFVNYRQPHEFTSEEKHRVALYADYAAIALHVNRQFIAQFLQKHEWLIAASLNFTHHTESSISSTLEMIERGFAGLDRIEHESDVIHVPTVREEISNAQASLAALNSLARGVTEIAGRGVDERMLFERIDIVSLAHRWVEEFVNQRISDYSDHAGLEFNSIKTDLEFPDDFPPVYGDEFAIKSIFQILIYNAVDAMIADEASRVRTMRLKVTGRVTNEDSVEIAFEDTGVGMEDIVISQAYQRPFSTKRDTSVVLGSGLGLPTVKLYTLLMNGSVEDPQSTVGKGTKMAINLQAYYS